jgi:enoyl-CoA hydratase/carnithine racemase
VSRQEKGHRSYGLAPKPTRALAALRRCTTEGVDLPFDEGLAIEREEALALGATADFREGLDAFLGRQPPVWSD